MLDSFGELGPCGVIHTYFDLSLDSDLSPKWYLNWFSKFAMLRIVLIGSMMSN